MNRETPSSSAGGGIWVSFVDGEFDIVLLQCLSQDHCELHLGQQCLPVLLVIISGEHVMDTTYGR